MRNETVIKFPKLLPSFLESIFESVVSKGQRSFEIASVISLFCEDY